VDRVCYLGSFTVLVNNEARRHIVRAYFLIAYHVILLEIASQHTAGHKTFLAIQNAIISTKDLAPCFYIYGLCTVLDRVVLHAHATRLLVNEDCCSTVRYEIFLEIGA
jgi:hypothetical protein